MRQQFIVQGPNYTFTYIQLLIPLLVEKKVSIFALLKGKPTYLENTNTQHCPQHLHLILIHPSLWKIQRRLLKGPLKKS